MIQKKSNNICVISENPVFISRIRLFARNFNYTFEYQSSQTESTSTSIILIDVNLLGSFLKNKAKGNEIKFIVHGNQKDLKISFDAGCTDFLRDPWTSDELEARISKIMSITTINTQWDNIILSQNFLSTAGSSIEISIEEYLLLKKLLDHRGEPVPREVLFFTLKGNYAKDSRVVDMHISNLRKKIEKLRKHDNSCCGSVKTVRNYGYMIS